MTRHAACSCGQLQLTIAGEPSRIAMCHCLECQRRTGAVISNQARFRLEQVSFAGKTTTWTRTAESGNALTYHFCPTCGSTVFWENEGFPGQVHRRHWQLRRPKFSRANNRSVGGDTSPVGFAPTRHPAKARGEAGMSAYLRIVGAQSALRRRDRETR